MEEKKKEIVDLARRLFAHAKGSGRDGVTACETLQSDGSQRSFSRLRFNSGEGCVLVLPANSDSVQMAEARSAWLIGTHLYRNGVPVPEPLAYEEESGAILFEDLGDLRLHDFFRRGTEMDAAEMRLVFGEAVRALARMQVLGSRGFDRAWCWQTPVYDRKLMLERESGYFADALCKGLLGLSLDKVMLDREFVDIADHAAAAPAHFFLHRDFQSRNLMLKEGRLRIIDFQGGRLGPLGYDLASLLIDPYTCLPEAIQEELLVEYLLELQRHTTYDPAQFRREYYYLALQRNLQILGAFAYLGGNLGKSFFLPFIRPALKSLSTRLAQDEQGRYPVLRQLVQTCQEQIAHHGL